MLGCTADQKATGHHKVFISDRSQHLGRGDIEGRHAIEVEIDADGALALATDFDFADTINCFEVFLLVRCR